MPLRFVRTPNENERKELHRMTQQEVGRIAEHARMVLLSSQGFIGRIKQYRRIATRYEKRARNYLAMLHLVSSMVWLL